MQTSYLERQLLANDAAGTKRLLSVKVIYCERAYEAPRFKRSLMPFFYSPQIGVTKPMSFWVVKQYIGEIQIKHLGGT